MQPGQVKTKVPMVIALLISRNLYANLWEIMTLRVKQKRIAKSEV